MKVLLKKTIFVLLCSLVILLIGWGLGLFLSIQFDSNVYNILFYEGLIILIIAVMASMKGNPSGINTQAAGQRGNQAVQHENLQVTRDERKATEHHKNFLQQSVPDFAFSTVTFIIGGIFLMVVSFILG